jgi:MFS family permease
LVLPVVVERFNWRFGWLALGLSAVGIAMGNFLLVRNPNSPQPEYIKDRMDLTTFLKAYRSIITQGSFWIIGTAYLLVGYNVIILFTFLPVYARESLMLPFAVSTRFISIIALFGIGGQLLLGTLSDKVGRPRIMIACGLILGLTSLGMLCFNSVWSLHILTALYGIGYGAVWPVYAAVASDLFSHEHTGGIVGLWTIFLGTGSIVAPVISGLLIDFSGTFDGVFISALLTGISSSVLLFTIPNKHW